VPSGYHHGWLVQLLPYLDERNVYLAVDRSASVYDPENAPVLAQHLRQLYCPSSTTPRSNWSDYAAVHHDRESPIDTTNDGVFFFNSRVRYDDISDGLAHTLFAGEKITDAFDMAWMSGTRGTLRNTGFPLNSLRRHEEVILPRHASWTVSQPAEPAPPEKLYTPPLPEPEPPPEPEPASESDSTELTEDSMTPEEFLARLNSGDLYAEEAEPPPPEPLPPSPARQGYGMPLYVGGFGSNHPGGANFALGDGSVRFIADSIDLSILQTLANRHDGKLPPQY
jgi:prepilin-type processing-associated H-X9-DG protein